MVVNHFGIYYITNYITSSISSVTDFISLPFQTIFNNIATPYIIAPSRTIWLPSSLFYAISPLGVQQATYRWRGSGLWGLAPRADKDPTAALDGLNCWDTVLNWLSSINLNIYSDASLVTLDTTSSLSLAMATSHSPWPSNSNAMSSNMEVR